MYYFRTDGMHRQQYDLLNKRGRVCKKHHKFLRQLSKILSISACPLR